MSGVNLTPAIELWQAGAWCMVGMVYFHDGEHYRAKFSHIAMEGWPPDRCPDLFDKITTPKLK